MIDYETIARNNHHGGMNCSASVYDALGLNNTNITEPPFPRSIGGKCGAVLAAEQTIRERGGTEEDVEEFERRFKEKFEHVKCLDLLGYKNGKCNDYVGTAAAIVADMGIMKDGE